jgi:hypothetical protein
VEELGDAGAARSFPEIRPYSDKFILRRRAILQKAVGGGAGFGRPVALKGPQYKRRFLTGCLTKSFTPDTADMSLNPGNR